MEKEITPEVEVITPEVEVKNTEDVDIEEQKVSEILTPKIEEHDTVPLSTFLEMKKESKNAQKQINELKSLIESGASDKKISKELKDIAEEHNVDEAFLQEFASTVQRQAEQEIDKKIALRLKPVEDKAKAEKANVAFEEHYIKILEAMPEYKDIANKDVIKSLSLDPRNQNKTFTKIIEETYGNFVQGKKTIETSTPRGGKDDNQDIDFSRIKDSNYFKEVMESPLLKEKYNQDMLSRLSKSL